MPLIGTSAVDGVQLLMVLFVLAGLVASVQYFCTGWSGSLIPGLVEEGTEAKAHTQMAATTLAMSDVAKSRRAA